MAEYKIIFDKDVDKDLTNLPKHIVKNVVRKAMALSQQPRPSQSLKLKGSKEIYRLRVGDYRIIYAIDDSLREIVVYHVRHRKDVYRGF